MDVLPCPNCESVRLKELRFVLRDGTVKAMDGVDPVSIGLVMAQLDEQSGTAKPHHLMRLAVPRPDEGYNSSSVILGITNGVPLACPPNGIAEVPAPKAREMIQQED